MNVTERFGTKVAVTIANKFPKTYFVGNAVRNKLCGQVPNDIDIATEATPEQVVRLLGQKGIKTDGAHRRYGVIVAGRGKTKVEIATLRKDLPSKNRYPKTAFITSPKQDSLRRDFTINALYLQPITGELLDFHGGIKDLQNKVIKFIGTPSVRIKQDPLRIVRAYRFAITLKFHIEKQTEVALQKHLPLVATITKSRLQKEINKISSQNAKKQLVDIVGKNS